MDQRFKDPDEESSWWFDDLLEYEFKVRMYALGTLSEYPLDGIQVLISIRWQEILEKPNVNGRTTSRRTRMSMRISMKEENTLDRLLDPKQEVARELSQYLVRGLRPVG